MVGRRSTRVLLAVVFGVIVLLALSRMPNNDITSRSQEYLQKVSANSKDWRAFGKGDVAANPGAGAGAAATQQPLANAASSAAAMITPSKTIPDVAAASSSAGTPTSSKEMLPWDIPEGSPTPLYREMKWFFQLDLMNYSLPTYNVEKLSARPPHNYRGPGHETYATYYATRNATMEDPYFAAIQQVIYRLLWDPRSKSEKHPVTVFVAPYVSQIQRDYFAAAGAVVREIELIEFIPNAKAVNMVTSRLQDMFSKLEMWNQTEFTRIAYLDSDAFPMVNVDSIFDDVPERRCVKELLPPEDLKHVDEICDYVYGGVKDLMGSTNAGVLVFSPNKFMHERLIRESRNQSNYDNGLMEQAFLHYVYNPEGAFPPVPISQAYNSGPELWIDPEKTVHIIHGKLWALVYHPNEWCAEIFNSTWHYMLDLYNTPKFEELREADVKTFADLAFNSVPV